MSYCRFENTSNDFGDCLEALQEMTPEDYEKLSISEQSGLDGLFEMAQEFIESYKDNIN